MMLIEELSQFSKETSVHGIKYIGNSNSSPSLRFLWLFLFIGALACACLQIKAVVECKLTIYGYSWTVRFSNQSYLDGGIWGWLKDGSLLEDGSPPWRLLWCPWGGRTYPRINPKTPQGVQVGPELGVVVIRSPFQTKFQFCRVPRMGGIKLKL